MAFWITCFVMPFWTQLNGLIHILNHMPRNAILNHMLRNAILNTIEWFNSHFEPGTRGHSDLSLLRDSGSYGHGAIDPSLLEGALSELSHPRAKMAAHPVICVSGRKRVQHRRVPRGMVRWESVHLQIAQPMERPSVFQASDSWPAAIRLCEMFGLWELVLWRSRVIHMSMDPHQASFWAKTPLTLR
jgi:hypothetical protein